VNVFTSELRIVGVNKGLPLPKPVSFYLIARGRGAGLLGCGGGWR
jgi:hypothetical protein